MSDAASYHQGEVRIGSLADGLATQIAVHLLFGVVANGAGVVENEIGVQFSLGFLVTHGFQDSCHPLGIGFVHLAAKRGDPVAASLLLVPIGGFGVGLGQTGAGGTGESQSGWRSWRPTTVKSSFSLSHRQLVAAWGLAFQDDGLVSSALFSYQSGAACH